MPGDSDYEEARRVWNGMIDRRPALIARCAATEDVATAVGFARDRQVLFSIRGGDHNVAGSAVSDQGMTIDISRMNRVEVDPDRRRVRVGALRAGVFEPAIRKNPICSGRCAGEAVTSARSLPSSFGPTRSDRRSGSAYRCIRRNVLPRCSDFSGSSWPPPRSSWAQWPCFGAHPKSRK